MTWVYAELTLVALAAMMSPTTLTFSVLALVTSDRPLRTGLWFYLGALGATLSIGVVAAFVLGNVAASPNPNTPKTWVAVVDVVAAVIVFVVVVRLLRRPADPKKTAERVARLSKVAASSAMAIAAAGATLANPGGFIPLALKAISETNPNTVEYIIEWLAFALVSLLPLSAAIAMLALAPDRAGKVLSGAHGWLERHAATTAAVLLTLLAAVLLRNGIAGLTS